MIIYYLCVKTHNITGLKYLCQTKRNPMTYNGSGRFWRQHLTEHGKEHTTEILKECENKEQLRHWGIHYSLLWNVVKSNEWANLKIEAGDGGELTAEIKEKIKQANLKRAPTSEATRAKLRAAAKRRKGFTPEGRQKVVDSNKNRVWTAEMKEKLRKHNLGKPNTSQKGKPQSKLTCPHCGKTGGISAIKHWHFDNCKLAVSLT